MEAKRSARKLGPDIETRECPDCYATGQDPGRYCSCSRYDVDPDCNHDSSCYRCDGTGFAPFRCVDCGDEDMPGRDMTCRGCIEGRLPYVLEAKIDALTAQAVDMDLAERAAHFALKLEDEVAS